MNSCGLKGRLISSPSADSTRDNAKYPFMALEKDGTEPNAFKSATALGKDLPTDKCTVLEKSGTIGNPFRTMSILPSVSSFQEFVIGSMGKQFGGSVPN